MSAPGREGTLLVIGDVHRSWCDEDAPYIERHGADHVLFVGDLGDEDVEMVEAVAALRVPKSVILGNHDAWASFKKGRPTPALRRSLDVLGADHIPYQRRELPALGVTLIGARPFSWGGPNLRRADFYQEVYGIGSLEESAERIIAAARTAHHRNLVVLAHNGPAGLSEQPRDIYGKDFGKPGGDWGDLDLTWAIAGIKSLGLRVPLVVAGHMHSRIAGHPDLRRTRSVELDGTLYVNPAEVPRIVPGADGVGTVRHYTEIRIAGGRVKDVRHIEVAGA